MEIRNTLSPEENIIALLNNTLPKDATYITLDDVSLGEVQKLQSAGGTFNSLVTITNKGSSVRLKRPIELAYTRIDLTELLKYHLGPSLNIKYNDLPAINQDELTNDLTKRASIVKSCVTFTVTDESNGKDKKVKIAANDNNYLYVGEVTLSCLNI